MSVRERIENYLRQSRMPETKFGRLAVNDPRLLGDIRRGRQLGGDIVSRIEAFIREHRA